MGLGWERAVGGGEFRKERDVGVGELAPPSALVFFNVRGRAVGARGCVSGDALVVVPGLLVGGWMDGLVGRYLKLAGKDDDNNRLCCASSGIFMSAAGGTGTVNRDITGCACPAPPFHLGPRQRRLMSLVAAALKRPRYSWVVVDR